LTDYIQWYAGFSFYEMPFGDVDNLVMSTLAYYHFNLLRQESKAASIRRCIAASAGSGFYKALYDSRRFGTLLASDFTEVFDKETDTQFAAMQFHLYDNVYYIAFRGTDNTLAGWKEDFNMAFMEEIPAQRMAREFLIKTAENAARVTVIGHSKGGNLALYASYASSCTLYNQIDQAVSFDGPGLNDHIIQSDGFRKMEGRMRVIRPRASLVGLLFTQPGTVRTIDSRVFSILQHYPYFWKTAGMDFIDLAYPDTGSVLLGKTLCGMLERLPLDAREQLIEAVYEILSASEAASFNDLADAWLRSASAIAARLFKTDSETKKLFLRALSAFLSAAADALRESFGRGGAQ
jgi:hypothetical protein